MGIWDTLTTHAKAQFLDVIEWTDGDNDTVVYRFPVFDKAITDQSKLIVRPGQAAVFVSEGQTSEVFGPGTYTLDTRNAPITSFFETIKYGLNYPYKGDILFVNTTQFTENRWGTANPFMLRDAEFGPVRIRAFGIYSFRVTQPAEFIEQIVGTDGLFTKQEITGQLKRKLVSALADTIGQARIPVLDLAANYMDLGDALRERMNPAVQEAYGITVTDFTVENISLPEAVEKALDDRTKMGVIGNLDAYAKLKSADAIQTAAANPGLGGAGVGMGVGFGMGNLMGQQMAGAAQPSGPFNPHAGMQGGGAAVPPPLPSAETFHYSSNGGQEQLSAEAIAAKVAADREGKHLIWKAGWSGWKPWTEVPEIATKVPPPTAAGPSFHYHGDAGSGEKSLDEIVALLRANPEGKHHLWAQGFDGWKPAGEVPEVAAALAAGPPPPPGGDGPPPPPM